MIEVNQEEIISTLRGLLKKLEDSLARMETYRKGADSPEEAKRWSSEAPHRHAEIQMCSNLIARLQGQ